MGITYEGAFYYIRIHIKHALCTYIFKMLNDKGTYLKLRPVKLSDTLRTIKD